MSTASQPSMTSEVFFVRGSQEPPEAPRLTLPTSPTFIARSVASALQFREKLIAEARQTHRAMRDAENGAARPSLAVATITKFPWVILLLLLGLLLGYVGGLVVASHARPWLVLTATAPAAPGQYAGTPPLATLAAPVALTSLASPAPGEAGPPAPRVTHSASHAARVRQPPAVARYGF